MDDPNVADEVLVDEQGLADELGAWAQVRRRERRMSLVLAGVVLVAGALGVAWVTRLPPAPPPQEGTATDAGAVVVHSPGYRVSFYGLERLHPADIARYDRIADHLASEGLVEAFAVPSEATVDLLARMHDRDYLTSLSDPSALSRALELTIPGFLGSQAVEARILAPFRRAVGGTVAAARAALQHGLGINLGGGFHHARPAMGHGFCVFNDVAVAIAVLRDEGFSGKVLIIDTDAHQGDGSHAFFRSDPSVFSFSMHQQDIFPVPKLRGDLDVGLPGGTDDAAFLEVLAEHLPALLDREAPALVIHVAGADVLRDDPLAGMALTPDGLVRRDQMVARAVRDREIPLVHLLAGGYGPSSALAQGRSVAALVQGDW